MDERTLEAFQEELLAPIAALEASLLELEGRAGREQIDAAFRSAHNIKSASAMLGLQSASRVAHELESVLELARAGQLALDHHWISQLLTCVDLLRQLVRGTPSTPEQEVTLRALTARSAEAARAAHASRPPASAEPQARAVRITLALEANALQRGVDPLRLLLAAGHLGQPLQAHLGDARLPTLEELEPGRLYLDFELLLKTAHPLDELHALFLFAQDAGKVTLSEADSAPAPAPEAEGPTLDTLVVGVRRVDALVNLTGELLVAAGRLEHARQDEGAGRVGVLESVSREIQALAARLQEAAMAVRLVPLGPTFLSLRRYVRDEAERLGKEVELELEGAQLELDKSVVERLASPLKHLVRNALDHGLEAADERQATGKSRQGRLRIGAREEQGQLKLWVEDDGRGIDPERVRQVAEQKGLVEPGQPLGPEEVLSLIYRPGFSTSTGAGELSGRGVGLDVVRRNIGELGGELSVASEVGRHTRFSVRVPLTLAVFEALILRCAQERLVLPLDVVQGLVRPGPGQVVQLPGGASVLRQPDQELPLLRLRERFGLEGASPAQPTCVVARGPAGLLALEVDEVLSQEAVLLKPLQPNLRFHEGLLGACVLGDGRVALVLDLIPLAQEAARSPSHSVAGGA